jgi:hypothetical protein
MDEWIRLLAWIKDTGLTVEDVYGIIQKEAEKRARKEGEDSSGFDPQLEIPFPPAADALASGRVGDAVSGPVGPPTPAA